MLAAGMTSAAGLALAFAGDYLDVAAVPAAVVFLLLVGLLNARGIRESVRANVVMTVVDISGLVVVVVLGALVPGRGDGGAGRALEFPPGVSVASAVLAADVGIPDQLFSLVALIAVAGGALLTMIMASRLVFGMAEQRLVPRPLGRVLPGRRTPWVAIVLTTVVTMGLTLVGDLGDRADAVVLLLVFLCTDVAVLVLRRDRVEHEHFRAPAVLPVPAIRPACRCSGSRRAGPGCWPARSWWWACCSTCWPGRPGGPATTRRPRRRPDPPADAAGRMRR